MCCMMFGRDMCEFKNLDNIKKTEKNVLALYRIVSVIFNSYH